MSELQEGALTGSGGQRGLDTVPGASTPPPTTPETIDLLLSSIDPLMNGEPWVCRHARRYVGNAAMAFPPKHPAMAEAIERLPDSAAKLPASAPNTTRSGPVFFTPIAQRHGIQILPEHYFFPYDSTQLGRGGKVHGAYASHHWNNRRTLRKRPL